MKCNRFNLALNVPAILDNLLCLPVNRYTERECSSSAKLFGIVGYDAGQTPKGRDDLSKVFSSGFEQSGEKVQARHSLFVSLLAYSRMAALDSYKP